MPNRPHRPSDSKYGCETHTFAKESLDASVDIGAVAIFEYIVEPDVVIERVWSSRWEQSEIEAGDEPRKN
jgi:hypothetical protein